MEGEAIGWIVMTIVVFGIYLLMTYRERRDRG